MNTFREKLESCLEYKLGVLALVIALGATGYWLLKSAQTPAQLAVPSIVLLDVEQSTITAPVKVYKDAVKKTLKLPKAIQTDTTKVVLTATDLPKSKHERTVTTVLDSVTGEATQYVENKPLQWLARESSGAASAYIGLKNLEPALRLQVTQDLFAVKALTLGVVASVDVTSSGRTDTFIGAGGRIDW
jgi:hypothetical protein